MGFLKNLFGGGTKETRMHQRYDVEVAGEKIPAVYVPADDNPTKALKSLHFEHSLAPTIFITGGAGYMSDEDKRLTREIFEHGIAPYAQEHQITVIDGATDSGVIEMMASARLKGQYTFPLIGIAPYLKVSYPTHAPPDGHPLAQGHSHFVFVTGDEYGAESEMLINMAHVLAGGSLNNSQRKARTVGIVVNGGKITRQEAYMASTKELSIPLIVLEGSGRFADELASAARTGETSQALLRSIIKRGDIQLVATTAGPNAMREKLNNIFKRG